MQISRYIDPKLISLEMETSFEEEDADAPELTSKKLFARKELILSECVDLLDQSGNVCNRNKLLTDLVNRERKTSTAIGKGIAIPHVRSMQAREFIIGICRSIPGYDFDSMDGKPVHLFVAMAAPPYDDNLYLRVFKALAEIFHCGGFLDTVMEASIPYDIVRAVKELE